MANMARLFARNLSDRWHCPPALPPLPRCPPDPPPQVAPDVDLLQLARDLPGLVGADLANIVNEAAMTAARQGRTVLTAKDIFSGVDRFTQVRMSVCIPVCWGGGRTRACFGTVCTCGICTDLQRAGI